MATIKIEIVAGANTYTRTKTITAAHLVRWVAAKRIQLNMTGAQTDAQVAAAWADVIFEAERQSVKGIEDQAAVDTAKAGVTPIELT